MIPFFSIIFPVYNTERYVEDSLKSIFSQTFKDFELIAINDGSTDQSLCILKRFAQIYPNLILISKENGGLSDARNIGMQYAKGKYLCFVDSDDLIHPHYLADFYNVIQTTQADICKNTHIIKFTSQPKNQKNTSPTHLQEFILKDPKIGCNVWAFAFKKALIDQYGLTFLKGRIFEDEPFVLMILPLAQIVFTFRGSPYLYRQHSGSIVANSAAAFDRIENFKDIIQWYQSQNILNSSHPIPFYILYDISIKNAYYKDYLQKSQAMLHTLCLEKFLHQDKLAYNLFYLKIENFIREHQKSRGIFKYYLKSLLGLL